MILRRNVLKGPGVNAANHTKACMLPDDYHMFRGGSGYESLKQISGSAIEIFHLNDFVTSIPREKQKESDQYFRATGQRLSIKLLAIYRNREHQKYCRSNCSMEVTGKTMLWNRQKQCFAK